MMGFEREFLGERDSKEGDETRMRGVFILQDKVTNKRDPALER